jgi:hypothetical protein
VTPADAAHGGSAAVRGLLDNVPGNDYPRPMIPAYPPEAGVARTGIAEGRLGFGAQNPPTAPEAAMGRLSATMA